MDGCILYVHTVNGVRAHVCFCLYFFPSRCLATVVAFVASDEPRFASFRLARRLAGDLQNETFGLADQRDSRKAGY